VGIKLDELLDDSSKRFLFVGIGNILKRDDGVGVLISRSILDNENILSLTVEVSIENYIGKINSINPDMLILIDCVDMNSAPGTYKLLTLDHVWDTTYNTHNISLKRLSEFFYMPIYILGIQPKKVDFGETLSYIVLKSANKIIQIINKRR
jgi:hydrogenase 3 maturation protease